MTTPTIAYLKLDGLNALQAMSMSKRAVELARLLAPKLSGASSSGFYPIFGDGYFGIGWSSSYIWYQEIGINPFTMRSLAGKTIPMWIDDPTGDERRKNPKAKTRTTVSGKHQVMIFRKAAAQGARKRVIRRGVPRMVPASYPGGPGRIALREAPKPYTTPGKVAGQVAKGNVGVRWRHPGLSPRSFIHASLIKTVAEIGITATPSMVAVA